jgi:hypothetical protein
MFNFKAAPVKLEMSPSMHKMLKEQRNFKLFKYSFIIYFAKFYFWRVFSMLATQKAET